MSDEHWKVLAAWLLEYRYETPLHPDEVIAAVKEIDRLRAQEWEDEAAMRLTADELDTAVAGGARDAEGRRGRDSRTWTVSRERCHENFKDREVPSSSAEGVSSPPSTTTPPPAGPTLPSPSEGRGSPKPDSAPPKPPDPPNP